MGVTAWNEWRARNPDVRPDLSEIDLTDASIWTETELWKSPSWPLDWGAGVNLDGINFSRTDLRRAELSGVHMTHADLSEARLDDATLRKAMLRESNAAKASFRGAVLRGANLERVDLTEADFFIADLCNAYMRWATLREANLFAAKLDHSMLMQADLSEANLANASAQSVDFTDCILKHANVAFISYRRADLQGNCYGVGGASEMYGDALFRRDIMDQDFLDTLAFRLGSSFPFPSVNNGSRMLRWVWNRIPQSALVQSYVRHTFRKPLAIQWKRLRERSRSFRASPHASLPILGATLVGLVLAVVGGATLSRLLFGAAIAFLLLYIVDPIGACGVRTNDCVLYSPISYYYWMTVGALVVGLGSGWLGRLLFYFAWFMFDFGRSWTRILLFAFVTIGLFGLAYHWCNGTHIILTNGSTPQHPFYPWFVAALGFATLGISDIARPLDGIGMLIMIGNVLAGFVTLGLLLSVLGNSFARRA